MNEASERYSKIDRKNISRDIKDPGTTITIYPSGRQDVDTIKTIREMTALAEFYTSNYAEFTQDGLSSPSLSTALVDKAKENRSLLTSGKTTDVRLKVLDRLFETVSREYSDPVRLNVLAHFLLELPRVMSSYDERRTRLNQRHIDVRTLVDILDVPQGPINRSRLYDRIRTLFPTEKQIIGRRIQAEMGLTHGSVEEATLAGFPPSFFSAEMLKFGHGNFTIGEVEMLSSDGTSTTSPLTFMRNHTTKNTPYWIAYRTKTPFFRDGVPADLSDPELLELNLTFRVRTRIGGRMTLIGHAIPVSRITPRGSSFIVVSPYAEGPDGACLLPLGDMPIPIVLGLAYASHHQLSIALRHIAYSERSQDSFVVRIYGDRLYGIPLTGGPGLRRIARQLMTLVPGSNSCAISLPHGYTLSKEIGNLAWSDETRILKEIQLSLACILTNIDVSFYDDTIRDDDYLDPDDYPTDFEDFFKF